jgi:hypothetical protein
MDNPTAIAGNLVFEPLAPADVDFDALDHFEDRLFCQRKPWLDFLKSFVSGEVVVARLMRGDASVGYFTGLKFRRAGFKILASPFRGWTTPYMGFNLHPDVPRAEALLALERLAFQELGCLHLEIADRYMTIEEGQKLGFSHRVISGYMSDLTLSEDDLFAGMESSCRRAIRKSVKSGVTIVEGDPDGFAEDYYRQLEHVFAKQGLKPSYGVERVQKLIDHCHGEGHLLLLRAIEAGGQCIATGLYPAFGGYSFFWGNGSDPDYLSLRPNEALHWHAMRHWKARGAERHDWGGAGAYKAKYGGTPFTAPSFWKSRHELIRLARDTAEKLYYFPRLLKRRRYDAKVATTRCAGPPSAAGKG